ncbi:MAG: LUD domain-containing protein [Thermoguttaceae bacterium]|nr:LUD domain-containing protein [Thermoguttaceae bacterium]
MATRDEILGSIKAALRNGKSDLARPEAPQVWPIENLSKEQLFEKFSASLSAVAGQARLCADRAEAAKQIAEELAALGQELTVGVKPGFPIAREVADGFSGKLTLADPPEDPDADPKVIEKYAASLVAADFLLADTGSAAIRSHSSFERLLCYLPPVCLIAAPKSALREHLPAAWGEINGALSGDSRPTGEYLLMTGPSRTADIEKILILGVHGPKKVVVFVIDNE